MTSGPIDSIRTCETEDANVCYESHGRDGQNRNILYKIFWLYLVGKAGPLRAAAWLMTWATFTLSWTTVNLLECSTGRVMPINNKTSRSLDAVARMQRFERYFPEMLTHHHLITKLKITSSKLTWLTDWMTTGPLLEMLTHVKRVSADTLYWYYLSQPPGQLQREQMVWWMQETVTRHNTVLSTRPDSHRVAIE